MAVPCWTSAVCLCGSHRERLTYSLPTHFGAYPIYVARIPVAPFASGQLPLQLKKEARIPRSSVLFRFACPACGVNSVK